MTATATLAQRKAALFAKGTTASLVGSLRMTKLLPPSPETSMTRAWLIEELERRVPAAAAEVEAAFDAASLEEERTGEWVDVDYVAVLAEAVERHTR